MMHQRNCCRVISTLNVHCGLGAGKKINEIGGPFPEQCSWYQMSLPCQTSILLRPLSGGAICLKSTSGRRGVRWIRIARAKILCGAISRLYIRHRSSRGNSRRSKFPGAP